MALIPAWKGAAAAMKPGYLYIHIHSVYSASKYISRKLSQKKCWVRQRTKASARPGAFNFPNFQKVKQKVIWSSAKRKDYSWGKNVFSSSISSIDLLFWKLILIQTEKIQWDKRCVGVPAGVSKKETFFKSLMRMIYK